MIHFHHENILQNVSVCEGKHGWRFNSSRIPDSVWEHLENIFVCCLSIYDGFKHCQIFMYVFMSLLFIVFKCKHFHFPYTILEWGWLCKPLLGKDRQIRAWFNICCNKEPICTIMCLQSWCWVQVIIDCALKLLAFCFWIYFHITFFLRPKF